MIGPLIGIGGVSVVLLTAEFLWQSKLFKRPEVSRKFVHILTGVFVAFWPFFMPFWVIQILSLLMLAVVVVSRRFRIFKSIHSVQRVTYGEYLFPVGVGITATFANTEWVYAAAMLHLSLADGLAAIVGTRFLKRGYKIFGQTKTLIGSGTFYLVSIVIVAGIIWVTYPVYEITALALLFWLPLVTTLLENAAVFGTDNVMIPLVVAAVLNSLQAAG